jgi:hypothetical protein
VVWALVVGATVGEGEGAPLDERGDDLTAVVDGRGGSVLVVWSVGRDLDSVGLLVTVAG